MNTHFISVDAKSVQASIADLMAAYPELAEDDVLLLDTIQGCTDLFEIAAKAVELKAEADAMADAIKARISDLESRKGRFSRQSEAMRKLIKGLMEAAGQTKLTLPEATISIAKGREKIVVDDVNALPQGTFTTQRIPDKDAIKTALDAGCEVPGARKEQGPETLVVRVK